MKLLNKHSRIIITSIAFLVVVVLQAQIPTGYYQNASGKRTAALKTALYSIIRVHTQLEYYSSSTYFKSTDWHPATDELPTGYFWDMYSNTKRTAWSGLNREHNMPKSWFGVSSGSENSVPAGTDLHNLYPSDATANTNKSNYPLGKVTGTVTFSNGVVKVGLSDIYPVVSSYDGSVFEPADEYKGDFARDYMYMVTCYEDYSNTWQSLGTKTMLLNNTYPVFKPEAIELLMKWHRQDPVDEKETNRNNEVYKLQKNRNPFIDHPELAEFIWGKYVGTDWVEGADLPVSEGEFKVGTVSSGVYKVLFDEPAGVYFNVFSLTGSLLRSGYLDASGEINIEDMQKGIYLVEVYTPAHYRYNAKLIKS